MATEILVKKVLILTVEEGMNEKGKPIYKRYTHSNINRTATAAELVDGASALEGLYSGPANFATVATNDLF